MIGAWVSQIDCRFIDRPFPMAPPAAAKSPPIHRNHGSLGPGGLGVLAILMGVLLIVGGCSDLPYYWQAGMGQLEILNNRRPLDEVLADPGTSTETRRKLRLIQSVQNFATERLAIPVEGHFRYYADLERPYVSWLVIASQPLALEEYKFCYFIVGCLGYRGFFDPVDAESLAGELRGENLDVIVRPARAYSTLGWFDDPVLNTFLKGEDVDLIATVIHEQSHGVFFLEGETAFNESFATFVETEGVRQFLAQFEDPGQGATLERFENIRKERLRFQDLLKRTRARLEHLYASDQPPETKRTEKAQLIEKLREDYRVARDSFKILNYEAWFRQPLNNAHFVGLAHYTLHVPAFEALFNESGRDFNRFYTAVESLAALPPAERNARLQKLEQELVRESEKKLVAKRHPR